MSTKITIELKEFIYIDCDNIKLDYDLSNYLIYEDNLHNFIDDYKKYEKKYKEYLNILNLAFKHNSIVNITKNNNQTTIIYNNSNDDNILSTILSENKKYENIFTYSLKFYDTIKNDVSKNNSSINSKIYEEQYLSNLEINTRKIVLDIIFCINKYNNILITIITIFYNKMNHIAILSKTIAENIKRSHKMIDNINKINKEIYSGDIMDMIILKYDAYDFSFHYYYDLIENLYMLYNLMPHSMYITNYIINPTEKPECLNKFLCSQCNGNKILFDLLIHDLIEIIGYGKYHFTKKYFYNNFIGTKNITLEEITKYNLTHVIKYVECENINLDYNMIMTNFNNVTMNNNAELLCILFNVYIDVLNDDFYIKMINCCKKNKFYKMLDIFENNYNSFKNNIIEINYS